MLVKFARWRSITDAWVWHRPGIWLWRPTLVALKEERQQGTIEDRTGLGTAQYDTESAAGVAPKGGLLDRAPHNITDELTLCLDVFVVVSELVCERQRQRARSQKTVKKGLAQRLNLMAGDYQLMYMQIINGLETGAAKLRPWEDDRFRPLNVCNLYFGFQTHLLRQLSLRELPELFLPPHCFIAMFDSPELALRLRNTWADKWMRIVEVEARAARGDAAASSLIKAITFLDSTYVRLAFYCICRDRCRHPDEVGEDVYDIGRSTGHRVYDEKAQEDIHGYIRDLSRYKRARNVGVAICFFRMRSCGVLESRGINHPQLDPSAVAKEALTAVKKSEFGFPSKPAVWNRRHNKILAPNRDWQSPTTATLFETYLAWEFLEAAYNRAEDGAAPDLHSKWWSACVPVHSAMVHELFDFRCFVLHATQWAFVCVELEEVQDETEAWRLSSEVRPGSDLLKNMTIDDPRHWKVWIPEPFWAVGNMGHKGLVFSQPEDCRTLLQHVLMARTMLTPSQLGAALDQFKLVPDGKPASEVPGNERLRMLVTGAGFTADEVDEVMALYAAAPVAPEEPQWDPDLDGLLEELAGDMADNAADLKAYRGDLKKLTLRRLSEDRVRARTAKQARLKEFRRKKAANKSAGPRKLKLRPVRVMKSKKRPLEPDAPAPPVLDDGGPVPAAEAAPPPPPPPPPVTRRAAPRAVGGWKVVELPHGWVRFHQEKG